MTVGATTSSCLTTKKTSPASEAKVGIRPGRNDAKVASTGATSMNGSSSLTPAMGGGGSGCGRGRGCGCGCGCGCVSGCGCGCGCGSSAATIFPAVLVTPLQQGAGSAKFLAVPPGVGPPAWVRVTPLKVTGTLVPAATESNVAVPPGFNVTPKGLTPTASALNNPVRVAVFVPSEILVWTSGNTSMNWFSGEPLPVAKKPE